MVLSNCFRKFSGLTEFPIIIDVNNVVYERNNGLNKPILNDFILLSSELLSSGFKKELIYPICDPKLIYNIDKRYELEALIHDCVIMCAPKSADEFILSIAIKLTLKFGFCFIISNDKFRDFNDQLPSKKWLAKRRVPFMFVGDNICLCPNIALNDIEILLKNKNINEEILKNKSKRTTLDVLGDIEKTDGEFKLF